MRMQYIHIKTITYALLLLGLTLVASTSMANIYYGQDKEGETSFSDIPKQENPIFHSKSQTQPKTNNTQPSSAHSNNHVTASKKIILDKNATNNDSAQEKPQVITPKPIVKYQSVLVTSPTADQIITHPTGNFQISIRVLPRLSPYHKLQVVMDGQAQTPHRIQKFNVRHAKDGEHRIKVNIVDSEGDIMLSSNEHNFVVVRAEN